MRKVLTETKEVTETKEIEIGKIATCNKCGREHKQNLNSSNVFESEDGLWDAEIHDFYVDFGYGSSYDMEQWTFDLCDDCLTDIVKTFKCVPSGFKLDEYSSLDEEEHQKVFEHWKETGKWEELLNASYDYIVCLNGYWNTDYLNDAIRKFHPDKPLLEDWLIK